MAKLPAHDSGHFESLISNYFNNVELPILALAKQIDALDFELIVTYEVKSFVDLKNSLLNCNWLNNENYWFEDNQPKNYLRTKLVDSDNFDDASKLCQRISFNIFLSFLAALDITFCSEAFGTKLKLRPLFLDLIPLANFEMDTNASEIKLPVKDRFRLPNRRLLELTHAIFYFSKNDYWQKKAVGRQELAEKMEFDEFNDFDETRMGNLYDGTKKLMLDDYDKIQRDIAKNVGKNKTVDTFAALHLAATFWLKSFVTIDSKNKIKAVILYDGILYKEFWDFHRKEWTSQLKSGDADWPSWLN
ncbi:hypothetical protein [Methylotenera sp.]|uniref:hypothetical protein n=1 Tax=Methylotenera sp. TaxID=2051956 RepID=UPI002486F22B|nr:hypothetical protein [Methylotenera sp.]MDI1298042.1 hypothetical protein [Methylotenera sp.]